MCDVWFANEEEFLMLWCPDRLSRNITGAWWFEVGPYPWSSPPYCTVSAQEHRQCNSLLFPNHTSSPGSIQHNSPVSSLVPASSESPASLLVPISSKSPSSESWKSPSVMSFLPSLYSTFVEVAMSSKWQKTLHSFFTKKSSSISWHVVSE